VKSLFPLAALLGFASLAAAQTPAIGTCPLLPADNIWNTRIDQLPVHPSSSTWVSTIGASSPLHPDFGSGLYNGAPIGIPYVTVPGTQTLYPLSRIKARATPAPTPFRSTLRSRAAAPVPATDM